VATECPAFSAVVACRKDFDPFCFKCRFSQITKMILSELAIQKVTALTRSYAILSKAHQGLPPHAGRFRDSHGLSAAKARSAKSIQSALYGGV